MDKVLWWFFLIVILGTIVLAMWLLTLPSSAEDLDWNWDGVHSGQSVRHHRHYYRAPEVRYYREPERDGGRHFEIEAGRHEHDERHCLDHHEEVVSTEHTDSGQEAALEAAHKLYSARVQWYWGSRFMNPNNAEDPTFVCDQSNAMDTIAGRITEGIQKLASNNEGVNKRCVFRAVPCSAPMERAEEPRR